MWFRGGSSANLRVMILRHQPTLLAETQCVSVPGTRTANSRPYHDNFRGRRNIRKVPPVIEPARASSFQPRCAAEITRPGAIGNRSRRWPRAVLRLRTIVSRPLAVGNVERLIGSIRRECMDHLLVFNAEHFRRILAKYASYYNEVRTHVSIRKDAPCRRPIERSGDIVSYPILGGLHHRYARI